MRDSERNVSKTSFVMSRVRSCSIVKPVNEDMARLLDGMRPAIVGTARQELWRLKLKTRVHG